jgi:hypothetical protein
MRRFLIDNKYFKTYYGFLSINKEQSVMSDTPQSNNSASKPKKPYKKNNNRRYKNNNNKENNKENKETPNNSNAKTAKSSTGAKRYANKNRRPKALTPTRLLQKYDNLLEQYLIARKKYNDIYGRGKDKQLDKVYRNYQHALKCLRDFENGLVDWQKEVLKVKIDAYPADRQFTTEHNIEPIGDEVSFVGEFEDPHLLSTQKEHEWTTDSEETQGTIDDYYQYKGITPPSA